MGAAVSNIGNWMQTITVPYVVYRVTGSRAWLGATATATFIPSMVGTLISAALVDRYQRRRLLLTLQVVQMAIAVMLFAAWVLELRHLAVFLVLASVGGLVGGLVTPAWNSFVGLLVPRESLASAVRLNSLQFAVGRAIGPAVAGAVLGPWGPGATFGINAVSFLVVIAVLISLRSAISAVPPAQSGSAIAQAIDGWRHVFSRRELYVAPVTVFFCGFFGSCAVQLAAAIVEEQFRRDRSSIGSVVSAFGLGSIVGSALVSIVGDRWRRSKVVYIGLVGWIAGLAILGTADHLGRGLIAMAVMGFAHVITATSVNTSLQLHADERYRGRAIATYLQGFFAGVALGAFSLAHLADAVGLKGTFRVGAAAIALFTIAASVVFHRMRVLDGVSPEPEPPPIAAVAAPTS